MMFQLEKKGHKTLERKILVYPLMTLILSQIAAMEGQKPLECCLMPAVLAC